MNVRHAMCILTSVLIAVLLTGCSVSQDGAVTDATDSRARAADAGRPAYSQPSTLTTDEVAAMYYDIVSLKEAGARLGVEIMLPEGTTHGSPSRVLVSRESFDLTQVVLEYDDQLTVEITQVENPDDAKSIVEESFTSPQYRGHVQSLSDSGRAVRFHELLRVPPVESNGKVEPGTGITTSCARALASDGRWLIQARHPKGPGSDLAAFVSKVHVVESSVESVP